jgi:hypothetical protein
VWVEGGDIQDELLDQLGSVLTAPEDLALAPSAAEFEALAAAVAARWPNGAAAPADAATPGGTPEHAGSVHPIRPAGRRPLRRLGSSAWRAGSVAAGIVVFSASAAAAANGGVPIPRPVRVVAYSVGLPVDSPALDDTNRHVEELKKAVKANDKPKAQATARRLQTDLTKVPGHEKAEAEQKVVAVMAIAEPLIVAPPTTTTSTAPAPSTTATTAAPPTTATTAEEEEKEKDKARTTTTTTAPATTTTTDPETTTTSTAPETDEIPSDGSGTPSGEPDTGSGDPGAGGAGTGGGEPGSTTPTTTPDGGTTTTTIPDGGGASGGGDPGSTTTTTSSTTTTTMPPPDPGAPTP